VDAGAAAVDLAHAEVDQLERRGRGAAVVHGLEDLLHAGDGTGQEVGGVGHPGFHDGVSFGVAAPMTDAAARM
jgi:hypothetical protein